VALDERMVTGSPDRLDRDQGWNPLPGNVVRAALGRSRSEDRNGSGAVTIESAAMARPRIDNDPITEEFSLPPLPEFKPLPAFASRPVAMPALGVRTSAPGPATRSASTSSLPALPARPERAPRHASPTERIDPAPEAGSAVPEHTGRSSGLTVLVLGATGALGSAIARALAAEGHRLVLQYGSGADAAAELLAHLEDRRHSARATDMADPTAVAELIAGLDDEVGGIDVVIDAVADRTPTATLDSGRRVWADAWSSVLSVDVLGAAAVAHAAAAVFRARRRGGRIILVPARGRPVDGPVDLAREAAAAAVAALGRGLARELAPHGIGVATVTAGPASASGWAPEDLAAAVVWLVNGPSAALPGAVFTVEG
jgi:NAD(P)-dependent dehydrogenase (short-subunit alcohol dehydrogenase family)